MWGRIGNYFPITAVVVFQFDGFYAYPEITPGDVRSLAGVEAFAAIGEIEMDGGW